MEIMSKAQACLIRCLRISGMTMAQIIDILELVWEETATLQMLEQITKEPTLDQAKLYSIACEISDRRLRMLDTNGKEKVSTV